MLSKSSLKKVTAFFLQYYLNQKTIFCHKVALHINRIVLFEEKLMFPSRDI